MLTKPSLAHYLTGSLLYGCVAAFLLAIGLLVWQAATVNDAPHRTHLTHTVSAGPFVLVTMSKKTSGNGTTASFALGGGWPGYILTCLGSSLAIGGAAWKYRQTRTPSVHG